MNEKKYEITSIAHPQYPWLHRIRALRDVREDVHAGDLGGFVQSEENLSQEGQCWIAGNAIVAEEAYVYGDAILWDHACVRGCAAISGPSRIGGNAIIEDYAIITAGYVHGNVHISGNAKLFANSVTGGIPVVYGGGLKSDNAEMLASIPEIDGGLIALTRFQGEIGFYPDEYLEIIKTYLGE